MDRLDQGFVRRRPVVHPARDLRHHSLRAVETATDGTGHGSDAAKNIAVHAGCVRGDVHLFPGRLGAVLDGVKFAANCPAVEHQQNA